MKNKKVTVAFLASIFFLGSYNFSSAIEYGMLGGKPANPDPQVENSASWFIYQLKAGEAKQDAITIMNLFDTPLDVVVYAADSTPSSNGGFALKQLSESKDEVGSWVKFYPTTPPTDFADIFQQHDKKIVEFCALDQAQLQKEFGKKTLTSDQLSSLSQWCQGVDLIDQQFKAKEALDIPFVFSVPENADTGEHTGGIMIQKKAVDDQAGQQGSTVKLTTRVGVRIYETVPGDIIRKLSLDNFQVLKNFPEFSFTDWFGTKKPREYLIRSDISNNGNVSLEHENNVLITDLLLGKESQLVERKFQVLKHDKFVANMAWVKPWFGHYSFQAQLKYQGNSGMETILSTPIKVWIIPWREMTLVALFLAILCGLYAAWRRYQKKKYGGIGWAEYAIKKNDTVATLVEKYAVDWKVLVKTNKLKAPYLLALGQIILVPEAGKVKKVIKREKLSDKIEEAMTIEVPVAAAVSKEKTMNKAEALAKLASKKRVRPISVEKKIWLGNKVMWLVAGAVLVVILITVGIFLTRKNSKSATINAKISLDSAVGTASAPVEKNATTPMEEKIDIAQISIKIFNEGAPAGSAGKIRDFLVSKGYVKTEAGNGASENVSGSSVVFSGIKFQKDAQWIGGMLAGKDIPAQVKAAVTDEEKSADLVIILGK